MRLNNQSDQHGHKIHKFTMLYHLLKGAVLSLLLLSASGMVSAQGTTGEAPSGLSATNTDSHTIALRWEAPTDTGGETITGYRLQHSSDRMFPPAGTSDIDTASTDPSHMDKITTRDDDDPSENDFYRVAVLYGTELGPYSEAVNNKSTLTITLPPNVGNYFVAHFDFSAGTQSFVAADIEVTGGRIIDVVRTGNVDSVPNLGTRYQVLVDVGDGRDSITLTVGVNAIQVALLSAVTETIRPSNAGICGRSPVVLRKILHVLGEDSKVFDCATVVISGITELGIIDMPLTLHSGDFAGLSALETLILSSNGFTSLLADIFAGLSALETLILSRNNIASLPADIFAGLSTLDRFFLASNDLSSLPDNTFNGIGPLASLFLRNSHDMDSPPLSLILMPQRTDGGLADAGPATVGVRLAQAAPLDLDIELTTTGGAMFDITGGTPSATTTVRLSAGMQDSTMATLSEGSSDGMISISTLPTAGTLNLAATAVTPMQIILAADIPTLSYTPAAGAAAGGMVSFTYTVSDGRDSSTPATLTLNFIPPDPSTVPTASTGLAVISPTSTQLTLSWTTPASNGGAGITRYQIERATANTFADDVTTMITPDPATAITHMDSGLTADTMYFYRVRAISTRGMGALSDPVEGMTLALSVPGAPTGLTAVATTATAITLSWTAPTNNGGADISSYQIERATDNTFAAGVTTMFPPEPAKVLFL